MRRCAAGLLAHSLDARRLGTSTGPATDSGFAAAATRGAPPRGARPTLAGFGPGTVAGLE